MHNCVSGVGKEELEGGPGLGGLGGGGWCG